MNIRFAMIIAVLAVATILQGCLDSGSGVFQLVKSDPEIIGSTAEPLVRVNVFYVEFADSQHTEHNENRIRESLISAQQFFANEMERHGKGRRTFVVNQNSDGSGYINHITLNRPESDYWTTTSLLNKDIREWEGSLPDHHELANQARERNWSHHPDYWGGAPSVFFIPMYGFRDSCGRVMGGDAWMFCWEWRTVAHELGHVLGLNHNFNNSSYIMSYGYHERFSLSPESAKWLDYHNADAFPKHESGNDLNPVSVVENSPLTIEVTYLYRNVNTYSGIDNQRNTGGLEFAIAWINGFPNAGNMLSGSIDVSDPVITRTARKYGWAEYVRYQARFDVRMPNTDVMHFQFIGKDGHQQKAILEFD